MRPSVSQTLMRTIELSSGSSGSASQHALVDEAVEAPQRGRVAGEDAAASSAGSMTPRASAAVSARASRSASSRATWRSATAPIVPTTMSSAMPDSANWASATRRLDAQRPQPRARRLDVERRRAACS